MDEDDTDLGAEDERAVVQEEGESAGEVEAPREPPPRRHLEPGSSPAGPLVQLRHRAPERRGVGGDAVAHGAELLHRRRHRARRARAGVEAGAAAAGGGGGGGFAAGSSRRRRVRCDQERGQRRGGREAREGEVGGGEEREQEEEEGRRARPRERRGGVVGGHELNSRPRRGRSECATRIAPLLALLIPTQPRSAKKETKLPTS